MAVVGTGASAITMINALRELAERHAETVRVEWIARGRGAPYARIENDPLPQRDRLHAIGARPPRAPPPRRRPRLHATSRARAPRRLTLLRRAGNELAQGRSPACLPVTFRGGFGVAGPPQRPRRRAAPGDAQAGACARASHARRAAAPRAGF